MKKILMIAVAAFVISTMSAQACRMATALNIEDVSFADVVVIGTVENYEIVRDVAFREGMLSNPDLSDNLRELYSDPNQSLLGDYARFEVLVSETIVGGVPQRFMATWDNSTFGEPASLSTEQLLMAFRYAQTPMPPLQGPSATVLPNPEPQLLTILQAPCAPPFLFSSSSEAAQNVREILEVNP
ncbi:MULTISPECIES: hypothetical protein [Roseobacteraceae]|uniref:Uncharacterized protein n=1 Tax=Pseudosulfitobacter pseudonitzschiae TaxID=1402135 RepID=A0A221JXG6_9RHOB|nr:MULTISPECIES: hypothetical protein [Roseobacteraceae]ASM71373.1 hypothetical protein SULPSESMR1_00539 [Pseudosulfitobacter pseudonitzschiae]